MKIISFAMQKGGTAKSASANVIADILGSKGYKVLLVDLDAQQNTTYNKGIVRPELGITDVVGSDCNAADVIVNTKYCDVLPADQYITNIEKSDEVEMTFLKDILAPLDYDFILLDCPPNLGKMSCAALSCSDYVIVPMDGRTNSMQGLFMVDETISSIKENLNPALNLLGILFVKFHLRNNLNKIVYSNTKAFADRIGTKVFSTYIPEGIALPEAEMMQTPLIDHAPKSKPCIAYMELVEEILKEVL